jgi:Resolvase, N terminal domain
MRSTDCCSLPDQHRRSSRASPGTNSTSLPLEHLPIGTIAHGPDWAARRSRDIDLYLHQQALDTSTPSGRAVLGMLGVFSGSDRSMIRDRVMTGVGSSAIIRQAIGEATDGVVQGAAHPCSIG